MECNGSRDIERCIHLAKLDLVKGQIRTSNTKGCRNITNVEKWKKKIE